MTIGINGEYGIGVFTPPGGFFRKNPVTTLIKQCNTCGIWKPETSEFFYHDGKEARELGWRSEGYCKSCRALKEAMARSSKESKQDRGGNIQRVRDEFQSGKRTAQPLPNLDVMVVFTKGLLFEKTVENRDAGETNHFIELCHAMVRAAVEDNSVMARDWLSTHKASIPPFAQDALDRIVS